MSPTDTVTRTVLVLGAYIAGTTAWIFAGLKVDATWHALTVFIAVAVFTGLVGLALGRWWAVLLPAYPLVLSLAAGDAGGNPGEDLNTVFDFALIATPFAVGAAGVGVLLRGR